MNATRPNLILTAALMLSCWAGEMEHAAAQDRMVYPVDVAVADDGTMYVADRKLPGIWKIANGERTIFFQGSNQIGSPMNAIRCVAVDNSGNVLAGDSATFAVYRFDADGNPTPAHTGRIGIPMGVSVDSTGHIYVSDIELGRIYRIPAGSAEATPERELVATIAAPRGIWVDDQDRVWVISARPGQLRRIETDGTVTEVIADMPFEYPSAVAVIGGQAYVGDSYADTIYRIAEDGSMEPLSAGEPLVHPVGLSVHDDAIIVADPRANALFSISADGMTSVVAGSQ